MKLDVFNIIAGLAALVVVLLIFHRLYLIYTTLTRENFSLSQCDYKAAGNGPLDCMNKCTDNPKCSYLSCENICNKCVVDKKRCPWDPEEVFFKKGNVDMRNKANETPQSPKINVTTTYGKAKLKFKRPERLDFSIHGYIYYIFKTFNKNEGVTMGLMPVNQCTSCEKVFEKLDTDTAYSVSVRGYNQNGLGEMSNIVMFKPVDKFTAKDYSLESAVDSFSENYEMCD